MLKQTTKALVSMTAAASLLGVASCEDEELTSCPTGDLLSHAGEACSDALSCSGGEVCCDDGTCFMTETCECIDGELQCVAAGVACPEPPSTVCPDDPFADATIVYEDGVSCEYGEECCCGQCSPSLVCSGTGEAGLACVNTDACFAPDCEQGLTECPSEALTAQAGAQCSGDFSCEGEEVCCPDGATCAVTELCECVDGEFICLVADIACPEPVETQCPDDPFADSSVVYEDGLRCEYGEECCCGECSPSLVCTGTGEAGLACFNTDFCLAPQCEQGLTECPDGSPSAQAGAECSGDFSCEGPEFCCPDGTTCAVTEGCECSDGEFICWAADILCPEPVETECPDQPFGDPNVTYADGLLCEYGQECCCGECHPSIQCFGTGQPGLACLYTDACLAPSCPPPLTECPDGKPGPFAGNACVGDFTCSGPQQCCPDGTTCWSDETCTCDGGQFVCSTTAFQCP